MIIIAYAHTRAVSVIFYYYMPQNRQSHRYSLCSVMSHVVVFTYPIELKKKFDTEQSYENSTKKFIFKKIIDKTSFHR